MILSAVLILFQSVAFTTPSCPRASLPAYSHNDYENSRPLLTALDLGYRGAEIDVFLIDGILRPGHDRRSARGRGSFESMYLTPLRDVVRRCGSITGDQRSFLLTVELKEESRASFDSLSSLLSRYPDLISVSDKSPARAAYVQVVLVGWHPPPKELKARKFQSAGIQHLVTSIDHRTDLGDTDLIRLVSLNYGSTIGRRWRRGGDRDEWLATARKIRDSGPRRVLRVYNVPPDRRLYRSLIDAGVDLIGTKTLVRSREPLLAALRR